MEVAHGGLVIETTRPWRRTRPRRCSPRRHVLESPIHPTEAYVSGPLVCPRRPTFAHGGTRPRRHQPVEAHAHGGTRPWRHMP